MNNRGHETNLAASYGANQIRPGSAAFFDNNIMRSHNALSGIANPPGTLAELKMKAKESILAKKAQNVRSSSLDTTTHQGITEATIAVRGESIMRNDTSETQMQCTEPDLFTLRGKLEDAAKSNPNFRMGPSTQKSLTDASEVSFDKRMIDKSLAATKDMNSAGVKSSSFEVEDLLAEGRAAAERRSRLALKSADFRSDPINRERPSSADKNMLCNTSGTGATATRFTDQQIPPDQHTSSIHVSNQPKASGNEHNEISLVHGRSPDESLTRQVVAKFTPEKASRDINSTKRRPNASIVQADKNVDVSDAPNRADSGHRIHESQSSEQSRSEERLLIHDPGVAGGQYNMDDVKEWLSMTGFYDELYRQKVLNRRRRMRAIEEEKLQLLLEEQADLDQRSKLVRSRSVLATNRAPISPFLARSILALPVLAPPVASSDSNDLGLRIKDSALKNEKFLVAAKSTESLIGIDSLKRRHSPSSTKEEDTQVRKLLRTQSNDDEAALSRRTGEKACAGSQLVRQQPPARTERFAEDHNPFDPKRHGDMSADHSVKRRYDQWVPDKPTIQEDYRRNSQDGRNIRNSDSDRYANRPTLSCGNRYSEYQSADHRPARYAEQPRFRRDSLDAISPRKSGINLRVNNVRYFLIKSWNYENIDTAQHECTWCTQTKNEDLFTEAFRNSEHVILIFSANNSHAFQGYARMQCLPGEPGVLDPTWRKYLRWPTTKPFKIRWITKGDSPYRVAGNLRNPLNDDSLVFVGRDGQEIPDRVGVELCEAIDEDTKSRGNGMDY